MKSLHSPKNSSAFFLLNLGRGFNDKKDMAHAHFTTKKYFWQKMNENIFYDKMDKGFFILMWRYYSVIIMKSIPKLVTEKKLV